ADRIAAHLGLFDQVYGSSATYNLKGANKATFLIERLGQNGYDYMADDAVDWPVWQGARRIITANASTGLIRKIDSTFQNAEHLTPQVFLENVRCHVFALRPHQWLKNILVFLPLLAAHKFTIGTIAQSSLAFVAFSMVASSVYLLNDLIDMPYDRAHPRKKCRPFACGKVPITHGVLMATSLFLAAIALSLRFLPLLFPFILVVYYLTAVAYSLVLKRILLLDIMVLTCFYTLRLLAGGSATDLMPSAWLVAFSIFFFLSLALVKRQAELLSTTAAGKTTEASGRAYEARDLPMIQSMATAAGYVSVLVLALYISSETVQKLYSAPYMLWLVCLLLLYWISHILIKTHRGLMTDDPIVFAIKDKVSVLIGVMILGFVIAGSVL
ncbi:MAG: UbiA family prenyltransferase, partial [Proteobacteria bacterium]|nr:UbiA family prenyltransferase [Pseudomonadota bacterium]